MLSCSLYIGGCNTRYEITSGGRVLLLNRSLERVCFECFYPSNLFLPDPDTAWITGDGLVASQIFNQLAAVGIRSRLIDGLLLLEFLNDAIPVDGADGRFTLICRRTRAKEVITTFAVSNG